MKSYELLAVIKPNLDMEEVEKVLVKIEDTVKDFGGNVSNIEKSGRKKLAYDVQNYRDGFFAIIKLEIPGDKIVEFKRSLKLNENVIRMMFMELSKVKA